MAIIGGDQGKAGESKGSGRKADDPQTLLPLLSANITINMNKKTG